MENALPCVHAHPWAHAARLAQNNDPRYGESPRKVDPSTRVSPHSYLPSPSWRLQGGPTESGPMHPRQPTRLSPKSELEIAGRAHGKWTHAPTSAHTAISKIQTGRCGEGPRKVDPCARVSPHSYLQLT